MTHQPPTLRGLERARLGQGDRVKRDTEPSPLDPAGCQQWASTRSIVDAGITIPRPRGPAVDIPAARRKR
jgi:hypothetical protein